MTIKIDVPDYLPNEELVVPFNDNSIIEGYRSNCTNAIGLRANAPGLMSLAIHLIELAQKDVPSGSHIHYDSGYISSITAKSVEIIIEKI